MKINKSKKVWYVLQVDDSTYIASKCFDKAYSVGSVENAALYDTLFEAQNAKGRFETKHNVSTKVKRLIITTTTRYVVNNYK